MARKLFGTDGVRGKANQHPITPSVMLSLAKAAGAKFRRGDHHHTVVIGKDTRLSGYMIETALASGFVAMGMDVIMLGPLPTPAVAMLTRSMRADIGVMISASHNPFYDNGVKFFDPNGMKLSDADEAELEQLMKQDSTLADSMHIGKAQHLDDSSGRYIEFAKATLPREFRLDGLKIVVDCAHGAAYKVAPRVLWELGADVIAIGVSPNGYNINDGFGATSPKALCAAVIEHKADLGIALDGDADRILMVDENGHTTDGDHLMAIIATFWKKEGLLKNNTVVATHMSNLGLERYLTSQGITLMRTAIGDRYVIEGMLKSGANVGGEQSGHLILSDYVTTGDGLIAALQILRVLKTQNKRLSDMVGLYEKVPQLLKNIKLSSKLVLENERVIDSIAKSAAILEQAQGRLLVRPSGTEPLVRIMGEADDEALLHRIVSEIADVIQSVDGS